MASRCGWLSDASGREDAAAACWSPSHGGSTIPALPTSASIARVKSGSSASACGCCEQVPLDFVTLDSIATLAAAMTNQDVGPDKPLCATMLPDGQRVQAVPATGCCARSDQRHDPPAGFVQSDRATAR